MLTIKNISAVIDATDLLTNISLEVKPGEIHAIMGPKRSGKSSLAHLISGHPSIIQTEGTITYNKKNLSKLDADDRAALGIYSTFQTPPEISGLTNFDLVKLALKYKKDKRTDQEIIKAYSSICEFLKLASDHGETFMEYDLMSTSEFRKNELLIMLMLSPTLAIVDEIDTDLDEDDLAVVGSALRSYVGENNSMILITNNQNLLDLVTPTHVYVLVNGEIKEQGDATLYKRIIEDGYSQFS